MKKHYLLLVTAFIAIVSFSSCSKEEMTSPQETLVLKEVVDNITYEKSFIVDTEDILTDEKGFIIELTWQPAEFDIDIFMDTDNNASYNTGLKRYGTESNGSVKTFSIANEDLNTYGFTLIHIEDTEDTSNIVDKVISYEFVVRRMSNNEVVKTITGIIEASDKPLVFGSETPKGFDNLGRFIKSGDKFYFGY